MFGRTIRKIGVIGSGNIGPDIALHFSQTLHAYGVPVIVVDIVQAALDAGSKKAESKMAKAAERGIYKKEEADAIFKRLIADGNYGALADYASLGSAARLAVPTPEHFLPLLYALALKEEGETIHYFNDRPVAGSITMTSMRIDRA